MEKPEWDRKVFDNTITSKWWDEIAASGQDVTSKMMQWMIQELQFKAQSLQENGLVRLFDHGVVKSDTAIPLELQHALKEAVRPLEGVPEEQKDYHPGSDNKVIDLVHPSLFPVVYGQSKVLRDSRVNLKDCFSPAEGDTLPVPPEEQARIPQYGEKAYTWETEDYEKIKPYSRKFQWMPCEVKFTADDGCRIVSYINNLHPERNAALYEVIENVIARMIPLWDESLSHVDTRAPRIKYTDVEYLPSSEPEPIAANDEEGDSDEFCNRHEEWEKNRPIQLPEPAEFNPSAVLPSKRINLRETFGNQGLQVIVKLANIELTPEKPEYEGGTWHVEGQLNEHISATAIYYYDSENITENHLAFRHRGDASYVASVSYPQNRNEFLYSVFGFGPEVRVWCATPVTQNVGMVPTPEGRLLTFPNILQHRVSPFSLADRSKTGHRKILALFLVDPNIRILSSANILPQQEDWWKDYQQQSQHLPAGMKYLLNESPGIQTFTMDEAKAFRLELMEERKATRVEANGVFKTGQFSLCEH
ncbi:hypothetical protein BBP40_011189 [Aspergillus hancockii]|nr:hypothetical protein BBP40_011189 [Aspergillus hancockii]